MPTKVPPGLAGIPNLGPATARDLLRLGVRDRAGLVKADPDALYNRLGRMDGRPHDPCVLDTMHAIIEFARGGPARPWWYYSRKRLAAQARDEVHQDGRAELALAKKVDARGGRRGITSRGSTRRPCRARRA